MYSDEQLNAVAQNLMNELAMGDDAQVRSVIVYCFKMILGHQAEQVTRCKYCGKRIVQDTAGRGWRHGETGPYQCCSTYAQPKLTPARRERSKG